MNKPSTAVWKIDSEEEWRGKAEQSENLHFTEGMARPTAKTAFYRTRLQPFPDGRSLALLVVTQSPDWQNWSPVAKVAPTNLRDAPVFLALGPENYWIFGLYAKSEQVDFQPEDATLEGFDIEVADLAAGNERQLTLTQTPPGTQQTFTFIRVDDDPWGNPYVLGRDGARIRVYSFGPDGQEGTDDDVMYPREEE